MVSASKEASTFKRAVVYSASAHVILFALAILSPYLTPSSSKDMTYYVDLISFPGGGGGGLPGGGLPAGGSAEELAETEAPPRETLAELTTPQKFEQEEPTMRFPVDKPKREPVPKQEKKTIIKKSQKSSTQTPGKKSDSSSSGGGSGSGIRIGIGSGAGSGFGFGSEYSSQVGLAAFPYTYYLQILVDTVSSNWYTSQLRTGISGEYFTTVFFKISRNGQISDVDVIEKSGIRALDISAVRAIQSSRFPPLPTEYEGEFLAIRLIFEHSK